MKKRAAEYKRRIGSQVEPGKLHEILWNAMDPASNMVASQLGVHTKDYDTLTEHIDTRYKITYGHVEFENPKDDPMGIFAVMQAVKEGAPGPTAPAADMEVPSDDTLDALGKGKEKAKEHG